MKKLCLIGLGVISSSFFGTANAVEVKPFVGADLSLNSVSWSSEANKLKDVGLYLPTSFFGFGAEAGAKLKVDGIYNPGITLAYDYLINSSADIKYPANELWSSVKTGFSAISATFDNYIRISGNEQKRSDFVFGIGLASVTERVNITVTPYAIGLGEEDQNEKDRGTFTVLKFGLNSQISDEIDWYMNSRFFIPNAAGDNDVQVICNLNFGLKYTF